MKLNLLPTPGDIGIFIIIIKLDCSTQIVHCLVNANMARKATFESGHTKLLNFFDFGKRNIMSCKNFCGHPVNIIQNITSEISGKQSCLPLISTCLPTCGRYGSDRWRIPLNYPFISVTYFILSDSIGYFFPMFAEQGVGLFLQRFNAISNQQLLSI